MRIPIAGYPERVAQIEIVFNELTRFPRLAIEEVSTGGRNGFVIRFTAIVEITVIIRVDDCGPFAIEIEARTRASIDDLRGGDERGRTEDQKTEVTDEVHMH